MPDLRRVAVTGLGIVSPLGNNADEVVDSLREGRSGVVFCEEYAERGFRSHVHGAPSIDLDDHIDRKLRRFMGDGSSYNYVAMKEAIASAGLSESEVTDERTGLVMGSADRFERAAHSPKSRVRAWLPGNGRLDARR